MTVAPYRRISTDSPVGRLAVTRELSWEIETFGVGIVGETGMFAGFFERSIVLISLAVLSFDDKQRDKRLIS
jgi:hypothetical protein